MSERRGFFGSLFSRDCGVFLQFAKYATVGALATLVQVLVFYLLASTLLKCLAPGDWAVEYLDLPSVSLSPGRRAFLADVSTVCGFVVSNVFCWLLNRAFVFRPGRHRWYVEFALFFGVSGAAAGIAILLQSMMIRYFGMMTSAAFAVQIAVALSLNFFARKFFVFKG